MVEMFEENDDLEDPNDIATWEEFMCHRRKKQRPRKSSSTDLDGCSISAQVSVDYQEDVRDNAYDRFQFVDSAADSGQTSESEFEGRGLRSPAILGTNSARKQQIENLLREIYGSDENIIDELDDTRDLVRRSSSTSSGSQESLQRQRSVDYTIWRLDHFSALSLTLQRLGFQGNDKLDADTLNTLDVPAMRNLKTSYEKTILAVNKYLVREVRRRDHRLTAQSRHCLVVSAILQLLTTKGDEAAKIRFSITPPLDGYLQWIEAMRSVLQLPGGLPTAFRKTMWITIANRYISQLPIEWEKFKKLLLHDHLNPEEEALGIQIVKDLHRTGCSGFCGEHNEPERHLLKRVLLAYARYRPSVGYCQGFNIIAAVILDVVDKEVEDALKIMIYLIEHVLPNNFFANDLEALSIDLAVFQELVATFLPDLSAHLDHLRVQSLEERGANGGYEPPLTNLFTIQWFLTLFATCLTQEATLRVWDCVFLYGSVILMKTALALLIKLEKDFLPVESAFDFYAAMQQMQQRMLDSTLFGPEDIIRDIFNGPEFDLRALRFKHEMTPRVPRRLLRTFWSVNAPKSKDSSFFFGPPRRMHSESSGRRNSLLDPEIDMQNLKKKYEDTVRRHENAKVTFDHTAALMHNVVQRRGSIFSNSPVIVSTPNPSVVPTQNPFVFSKSTTEGSPLTYFELPVVSVPVQMDSKFSLNAPKQQSSSITVYSGLTRTTSQ